MKQEARPSDGLESPGFSRWEEVNRYSWAAAVDALAERFRDGAEPGTTRVRSREVNSAGRHGFRVPVLRCSPPPLSFDETPLPRLCAGVLVER